MEFEWDLAKEAANFQKHGIEFMSAIETFFDPHGFQMTDQKHSRTEPRFYWIGKTKKGRVLSTWFTTRESTIRIIGCAEWRIFRRLYYETTQNK